MKKHGITKLVVDFDGAGDSGQISDFLVEGLTEGNLDGLFFERLISDGSRARMPLREAIEEFVYAIINRPGIDWYNNDGGFGRVEVVADTGQVLLEMNERFTDSKHSHWDYSTGNKVRSRQRKKNG